LDSPVVRQNLVESDRLTESSPNSGESLTTYEQLNYLQKFPVKYTGQAVKFCQRHSLRKYLIS